VATPQRLNLNKGRGDTLGFGLILLGTILAVLVGSWRIHQFQRDIDDYYQRDYRAPLVFQWRGWL
jgi:hypothetical protein